MRTLLVSALAFGAMTSVALAAEPIKPTPAQVEPVELAYAQTGPVELTDTQMDKVTAGLHRGHHPLVGVGVGVGVDIEDVTVVIRDNEVNVCVVARC